MEKYFKKYITMILIVLATLSFGCHSKKVEYIIENGSAEKLVYARKDPWTSGKVVLIGVKSNDNMWSADNINIHHGNPFMSVDVDIEKFSVPKVKAQEQINTFINNSPKETK